jgi:hypothetical protein
MTTDQWLVVVGIAVAAVLSVSGGIVGWMVSVASSLSSIKGNTSHLADRIDSVDEATKGIVTTLGEHSERIEDLGLKVNTLQIQFGAHDVHSRKGMGS